MADALGQAAGLCPQSASKNSLSCNGKWSSHNGKSSSSELRSQFIVRFLLVLLITATTLAATAGLIILRHDGGADAFDLLLLLLNLLGLRLWVRVEPGLAILQGIPDLLLLVRVELLAQ